MYTIKLFLASSIVEFENERLKLKAFESQLNDIYEDRDIRFKIIICENISNAFSSERKQDEYNKEIRESQYFYIIFGSRAGQYTIEEFNVAFTAFQEKGFPKIYTYFQKLPGGIKPEESVLQFRKHIEQDMQHYTSEFTDIDTIKLNMLVELALDSRLNGDLSLEDGQAHLRGIAVMSLEQIQIYKKNETITKLQEEKKNLENEYVKLISNSRDDSLNNKLIENSKAREEISKQLHELEKEILNLFEFAAKNRRLDKSINWREREAIKKIDEGNYDAAKKVLEDPEWEKEVQFAEEKIGENKKEIIEYISGQRLLIQAIKSHTYDAKKTNTEIEPIYEKICHLAGKYQIELDTYYDYAFYLYNSRGDYKKAFNIIRRLQSYLSNDIKTVPMSKIIKIGLLWADCNSQLHDYETAEKAYRAAIKLCEGRKATEPQNRCIYQRYEARAKYSLSALLSKKNKPHRSSKPGDRCNYIILRFGKAIPFRILI